MGFSSEKDLNQALGRNKNFIGGKRIYLKTADKVPIEAPVVEDKPRPWELKQVGTGTSIFFFFFFFFFQIF